MYKSPYHPAATDLRAALQLDTSPQGQESAARVERFIDVWAFEVAELDAAIMSVYLPAMAKMRLPTTD